MKVKIHRIENYIITEEELKKKFPVITDPISSAYFVNGELYVTTSELGEEER